MSDKTKILVADDDVQHVDMIKTLLESTGYEVRTAYRPDKAIELARSESPDLILLDVMFAGPPGPDGIETARQIKKIPELAATPVIILSGVRKVLDLPFPLEPDDTYMPVRAFLEKPIKPDKLLAEIRKVLDPGR